jgi:hypothetical protein
VTDARRRTIRLFALCALAWAALGILHAPRAAAQTDTYPLGTIAFFNLSACPTGWAPAQAANGAALDGYFVVPFYPPVPPQYLGVTVGTAMGSGENRQHAAAFSSSISLPSKEYVGIDGCCNDNPTSDGEKSFSGTTGPSSSAIGYVQLLLCQKTAFTKTPNLPVGVPEYVVTFYSDANCPTGWKPTLTTTGRFLVGLPAGGTPGTTFGGPPLSPTEDRVHTHALSGNVDVPSYGVGLGSGCCAHGYGGAGTFGYTGITDPVSTGLPYVVVTQCQPCTAGDQDPACPTQ